MTDHPPDAAHLNALARRATDHRDDRSGRVEVDRRGRIQTASAPPAALPSWLRSTDAKLSSGTPPETTGSLIAGDPCTPDRSGAPFHRVQKRELKVAPNSGAGSKSSSTRSLPFASSSRSWPPVRMPA